MKLFKENVVHASDSPDMKNNINEELNTGNKE
jgi:hypothetical protein